MAVGLKIVDGDIVIQDKKCVLVSHKDKASRDFYKFLVTESEHAENKTPFIRYNPKYGTELNRLSNYKNLDRLTILDVMNSKLREALQWYTKLQESRTNLSLGEIITSFNFVIYNHPLDPQSIVISIDGRLASGETINFGNFGQQVQ